LVVEGSQWLVAVSQLFVTISLVMSAWSQKSEGLLQFLLGASRLVLGESKLVLVVVRLELLLLLVLLLRWWVALFLLPPLLSFLFIN